MANPPWEFQPGAILDPTLAPSSAPLQASKPRICIWLLAHSPVYCSGFLHLTGESMSPIFMRSSRVRLSLAVSAFAAASIVAGSGSARASGITNSADDLRTGWYSDQQSLTPQLVSSGPFSQVFSTPIVGQVYAQPLVYKGSL